MTARIGSFDMTRNFSIGADKLWHLLTDASEREAWGAPSDDHVLVSDTADLRGGGNEVHRCGPKDDPEYVVHTYWYRLDAPAFACFTETLEFSGMLGATSLVTYDIEGDGEGTTLTVYVTVSSFTGEDMVPDFKEGWTSGLDRLVRYAQAHVSA